MVVAVVAVEGTALHWAAYSGRDKLVEKLVPAGAALDGSERKYQCMPLGWTLECLASDDPVNKHEQARCIELLVGAGADPEKLSEAHRRAFEKLTRKA